MDDAVRDQLTLIFVSKPQEYQGKVSCSTTLCLSFMVNSPSTTMKETAMRSKTSLTAMIIGAFVTSGVLTAEVALAASGDKAKWACMKDGKGVKVKGKSPKDKKKACEDQGGTWGKKGDDGAGGDAASSFGTSSGGGSGGSGGW